MDRDHEKLPGKTVWAGRRRPMTRKAGFSATSRVEITIDHVPGIALKKGQAFEVTFGIPESNESEWVGFGCWFAATPGILVSTSEPVRAIRTEYEFPNWNKYGSLMHGPLPSSSATITFTAKKNGSVFIYDANTGKVVHDYLTTARAPLQRNMWSFAPESNFYDPKHPGTVTVSGNAPSEELTFKMALKSCNRCGRFLPINLASERAHLSFSNHCVAVHRRPCGHSGFGRITDRDSGATVQLEYGFQLECRFCKKFEVNAAHNPQRTTSQMKEDGARRRHFELLLEHLYGGSPQLRYKSETGRDLSADIYDKFEHKCFKCGTHLASERSMHLDHTRPLALLWPLDGSATALCETCNSSKRDRSPSDFYTEEELTRLSELTGIPIEELNNPGPNMAAIELLGSNLDWFRNEFLKLPALQKIHDGKKPADLIVKALRKVLSRCVDGPPYAL
jgi:hypothetical protein